MFELKNKKKKEALCSNCYMYWIFFIFVWINFEKMPFSGRPEGLRSLKVLSEDYSNQKFGLPGCLDGMVITEIYDRDALAVHRNF